MKRVKGLLVFLSGCMIAAACAAQDFPSKPIRLIVPFPAGGAVDTIARKLGNDLGQRLGTTVIVENKPGASTIIGTDFVAKAPADGYTLLLTAPAGIVQGPWLQKLPYDPLKDLTPVYLVAKVPTALLVPVSLQVNNYKDFVAYSKGNEGKMSYASLGNGSTAHIFGEMLSTKLAAKAVHVPYKGDAPAMVDLVSGRVQYIFNNVLTGINFSKQGRVKILAVTGDERLRVIPDVPTMRELGVSDFDIIGWYSLFAPAGLPRPVAEKIHAAVRESLRTPEFSEYMASVGVAAGNVSLDDFKKQVNIEYVKWGELIKANNIHAD
jgi:tripartite-type tricarboxylate transporter receptor subunit TctC